jgi:hypothetical protein
MKNKEQPLISNKIHQIEQVNFFGCFKYVLKTNTLSV